MCKLFAWPSPVFAVARQSDSRTRNFTLLRESSSLKWKKSATITQQETGHRGRRRLDRCVTLACRLDCSAGWSRSPFSLGAGCSQGWSLARVNSTADFALVVRPPTYHPLPPPSRSMLDGSFSGRIRLGMRDCSCAGPVPRT